MKNLKLETIAREAGVSISTVSRVLNGTGAISAPVRERVLALAKESGYFGERRKHRVLAIIVSFIRNLYANYAIHELQLAAQHEGFQLEFVLPEYIDSLKGRLLSGAIALECDPAIPEFWRREMDAPLVVVDGPPCPYDHVYSIYFDEDHAMGMAIDAFLAAGRTRIGLFQTAERLSAFWEESRFTAFKRQIARRGLGKPLFERTEDLTLVETALHRLLDRSIDAMIYICTPDVHRLDRFLEHKNIRLPRDLAIIAWDMLGLSPLYRNDYTIIQHDYTAFADTAIQVINNHNRRRHPEHRLPVHYRLHPSRTTPWELGEEKGDFSST